MHQEQGLEVARACARAASDIKAEDITILDVRGLSSITDYLLICTTASIPQQRAVVREVEKQIHETYGYWPVYSENSPESMWSVLDYIDVMVHVMSAENRQNYGIETLWADARRVETGLQDN